MEKAKNDLVYFNENAVADKGEGNGTIVPIPFFGRAFYVIFAL